MAKKLYEEEDIRNIANAIREKTEKSTTLKVRNMAQEIRDISTGVDFNEYFKPGTDTSMNGNYSSYYAKRLTKLFPIQTIKCNMYDLQYAFYDYEFLNDISPLTNWNVASVYYLQYAFYKCYSLKNLEPLKNWSVSRAQNFSYMFYGLGKNNNTEMYNFDSIKDWNTSAATNMSYMFNEISSSNSSWLNTVPDNLELNWNVDKVTTMASMFSVNSSSYNGILKGKISGFFTKSPSTSNVTANSMFKYQKNLKIIDFSKVNRTFSNVESIFYYCTSLQLADIRGLTCSGITSSTYYNNALYSVPKTAKIIVKNATEKTWWQGKFSSWSSCFYTVDEAITAGIIES